MGYLATITSKRQLTIPSDLFKKIGLSKGDKVLINEKDGELRIKQTHSLIEELAGSVTIKDDLKRVNVDKAIKKAKIRHFRKKL